MQLYQMKNINKKKGYEMKTEDTILESLLKLAINKKLPESEVLDISDEYHISILQYSKICDTLLERGYEIVPDEDYRQAVETEKIQNIIRHLIEIAVSTKIPESELSHAVDEQHFTTEQYSEIYNSITMQGYAFVSDEEYQKTVKKNASNQPAKYEAVISEFNKLELSDKYQCLIKLALIISEEDEKAKHSISNSFMQKIRSMKLQYSYITLLLKAFFSECNADGEADLNQIIIYFDNYYCSRQKQGLISEQSDSVLGKPNFSKEDIRRIILFNPLKRSFLTNYFVYHKTKNSICINEALWSVLSSSEKEEILSICNEKLNEYYERIEKSENRKPI